jgi:RNA polymerase sigma-70 factor (ECF subfamily)
VLEGRDSLKISGRPGDEGTEPMVSEVESRVGVVAPSLIERQTLTIERVFREHFDHVYRIVGRLLGPSASSSDIDDVTQQVFLTVHRALPKFRGESTLSTWLYGIASNVVLTNLRGFRRQRRLRRALELAELTPKNARTPEQSYAEKQELVAVWKSLLGIKPNKRIVYVLYEIEGLSGAEIAVALGIPQATVFTRLHHARREVAKALLPLQRGRLP